MLTSKTAIFAKSVCNLLTNSVLLFRFSPIVNSMSLLSQHRPNLIAVCQLTATNSKEDNLNTCKHLITSAVSAGAKMVFLPEAFDFIGESKEDSLRLAEPVNGYVISSFKDLAKSKKVWLSLGGAHVKMEGSERLNNSHLVINDSGQIVAAYNKVHLFDVDIPEKRIRLKESDIIEKGKEILPPIDTPIGKLGLAICYDLRFPEMSLSLRAQGAQVLTFPSAFTFTTGSVHWEVLLRTRAIENQCYVVAAAQTGIHNKKRSSWGHAMVVAPSGTVIAQCPDGTGFVLADIDLEAQQQLRINMPVWSHRRYDLYPSMIGYTAPETASSSSAAPTHFQFGQVQVHINQVFYKTQFSFAFTNKCCVVPGHVLVASLRPAERLKDLTPTEVADLFQTVQKVETVMERVHNSSAATVAVQDGPLAGQTIRHVHVHILPRKPGDFEENDQIYYELQKHDKADSTKKWRSEEEMSAEAELLKTYFLHQ